MKYGGQSSVDTLKTVLVKRPDKYFAIDDYKAWGYKGKPDLVVAQQEHDAFVDILFDNGIDVYYHTIENPSADSIFVRDPALITDKGALILKMAKPQRRGEEEDFVHCMQGFGIPYSCIFHERMKLEGGDLLWLDDLTLIVGLGFRTHDGGRAELAKWERGFYVYPVQLPYWKGPKHCLHLTSIISMVDHKIAVAYLPLLPIRLYEHLECFGIEVISVPEEEFETGAANVLAIAPGKCLMLENNLITQKRLEQAGCEVLTFKGEEICLNVEGGPTCLVNPILREKDNV